MQETVLKVASQNKNIFFIFMNINNFVPENEHYANIKFLPCSTDSLVKERFINTCNAMIHARYEGETFGLAVAEFSMKNKPVITFKNKKTFKSCLKDFLCGPSYGVYDQAHIINLGTKGIYYSDGTSLEKILTNFQCYYNPKKNYDAFSRKFSEKKVMRQFEKIIAGKGNSKINFHLSWFRRRLFNFLILIYSKIKNKRMV